MMSLYIYVQSKSKPFKGFSLLASVIVSSVFNITINNVAIITKLLIPTVVKV